MSEVTAIWDQRYSKNAEGVIRNSQHEPWLDRWQPVLAGRPGRALDIGCGPGFDTEVLLRWGFQVTALDVSRAAIALAKERNPAAIHAVMDVRNLGCLTGSFDVIVASLSLHYFNREETEAIFNAIHGLSKPGGFFAFRVNAFDDVESGAPGDSSAWECVSVGGVVKQFFTREKIADVLGDHWRIFSEEKLETRRYGHRKTLFEVIAKKHPN
jgi:SAM-dependent methyltransferase